MYKRQLLGLSFSIFRDERIRITYRYGTETVPGDVKLAVMQKCATKVLETSFAMNNIEFGGDKGMHMSQVVEKWNQDYDECVLRRADWTRVEY